MNIPTNFTQEHKAVWNNVGPKTKVSLVAYFNKISGIQPTTGTNMDEYCNLFFSWLFRNNGIN